LPICTGEQTESENKSEEDDDEDDVGSEGAHQVYEAENTHEDEEETEGGGKSCSREAGCFRSRVCWGVGSVGVVERLKGSCESEPEGTEGNEDHKREGIAENPFEEAADDHEESSKEVVSTTMASQLRLWANIIWKLTWRQHRFHQHLASPSDPQIEETERGGNQQDSWYFRSAIVFSP